MAEMTDRDGRTGAWLEAVADTDGELVLELGGEVDIASIEPLRDVLDAALAGAPRKVVFELRQLNFMDSSGIALLISAAQRVGRIELRYPQPMVRRVIELAGLTSTLPITS
jgi:anti-anti-sigma factor